MTTAVVPARKPSGPEAVEPPTDAGADPQGQPERSHRERKKQATRQAIHQAAFELVDEHGLSHVTIEAISEQAGVAPRTFWAYFASKEAAVIDHHPERAERLRADLLARPAEEDPLTALLRVTEKEMEARFVDPYSATRRHALIRREPQLMAAVAAMFDEMARTLVETLAERIGTDPEIDMLPEVVVFTVLGISRVAQQRWAAGGCSRPFTEVIGEALAKLADALVPVRQERRP